MTLILLFASIHQVMRAEGVLGEAGIGGSMVPIPHQISTDCGMGWSLPTERVAGALAALAQAGLKPAAGWAKTEAGWATVDPCQLTKESYRSETDHSPKNLT